MENMRKVRKTMMKVLGYLIIFLFMMMTAVGSYQIITRYFFNRPSTVSEELLTIPLPGCPFWRLPMFSARETI